MKIARKWCRWWSSQLKLDVVLVVIMLLGLNVCGGLLRVADDRMSESLRPGDLVYLQKMGVKYASGDITYACVRAKSCELWRIIATEADDLEFGEEKLYVNMELKKRKLGERD